LQADKLFDELFRGPQPLTGDLVVPGRPLATAMRQRWRGTHGEPAGGAEGRCRSGLPEL